MHLHPELNSKCENSQVFCYFWMYLANYEKINVKFVIDNASTLSFCPKVSNMKDFYILNKK